MDKSNHRNNGAFIFCVILILGDRNLFHKRILCNHKNDFLKNKEKPENTAPQKEKITLKLHNYFSYTKKCLKNKKLIFTQTQFSVLRHYNKGPTLENQWDNPAADLGATWLETQYILPLSPPFIAQCSVLFSLMLFKYYTWWTVLVSHTFMQHKFRFHFIMML